MKESDMLGLLRAKYTRPRVGTTADRFVRAQHVRYPADWYKGEARAIADYIVADTYGDCDLIGFEVKVSRSDWLAELRQPAKAEWWRAHCNRWYLVTSDRSIVRDDLPDGWGHMTVSGDGLRIVKRSPRVVDVRPLRGALLAQWARATAQTAQREAVERSEGRREAGES